MSELNSNFNTAPDGVLTNECGVISGPLHLRTTCGEDGALKLEITYQEADEWYTLAGSDYRLADPADHEVIHRLIVNLCTRPSAA